MKNVDVVQVVRSLVMLLSVMVLWSCVTPMEPRPEWTRDIDELADGQLVAYGRSETEDDAVERARKDAVAQISQILARDLQAQGIAVTSAVGAAVENRTEARLEVLEPVDRFRRRDAAGAIEQYLLYEYLPEHRNRDLAEIYETAGLEVPTTSESESIESAPDPGKTEVLIESVRFLLSDPIPESIAERQGRLEEIRRRTERVSVTLEPREQTVPLGEPLPSELSATVQTEDRGEPLSDVPLRVEFRGPLVDGRRAISKVVVRTEGDGTARIPAAPPALAGTTIIEVEPAWLADEVRSWEAVLESSELRDLLSSIGERLRARAAVQVTSEASSIPTAMVVLDRDIAGNPIESADTMRGMAQEFIDTDFRVREVDLSGSARRRLAEAEADSISVADLYDILPFDVLSRMERVIVGHAHILEFREEEGFTVVVEVEAGAFDLRRDEVLARVSFEERVTGSDARSAIRTAFQAAGRRLVRRIVPRLP